MCWVVALNLLYLAPLLLRTLYGPPLQTLNATFHCITLIMMTSIFTRRNLTSSVRNCLSKDNYSFMRKFFSTSARSNVPRHVPNYATPARFNLIGRVWVACSGAATRRMRACARLNEFILLEDHLVSPKQFASGLEVALSKFKKSFTNCKSSEQRAQMMASLSDRALAELQREQNAGGLKFSGLMASMLLDLGIQGELSNSQENRHLEDALKRELEKRRAA